MNLHTLTVPEHPMLTFARWRWTGIHTWEQDPRDPEQARYQPYEGSPWEHYRFDRMQEDNEHLVEQFYRHGGRVTYR